MAEFATDDMAHEVLALVRNERSLNGYGDNVAGYDALDRIAPALSCLKYGHPDQPKRRLKRFRQQPWRCNRCGTWWVTEHRTSYATMDTGGFWAWVRVDHELDTPDALAGVSDE